MRRLFLTVSLTLACVVWAPFAGVAYAQNSGAPQPGPIEGQAPPVQDPASTPPPTVIVPLGEGGPVARQIVIAPQRPADTHSFEFGSYGRVHFANDLRGHTGRNTNIVAHGTRISEDDYAEIELRREDRWWWDENPVDTRIVATLALFGPYFHQTAKIPDQLAVRNLYLQSRIRDAGPFKDLTIWGGSRMYRGDDIYLLNWWPLDNQNTNGAGLGASVFRSQDKCEGVEPTDSEDTANPSCRRIDRGHEKYETIVAAHVGQQRLDNPYQTQTVPVVAPFGFGATNVLKLDRPRTIETLKVTQFVRDPHGTAGFKAVLYGELHQLGSGVFKDPLNNEERVLPSDSGWLAGSQLTYYTGKRDTYVSLVLRHARGVAAYDPLAVPTTFANDRTTSGSSETTLAIGGNYEAGPFGVLVGGYLRFFRDGGTAPTSTHKYDEGTLVVRPQAFIKEKIGVALEGSYQARRMQVADATTNQPLTAGVTRLALIPFFAPTGPGSFKRPQLYGIYSVSFRDSGAAALYAVEDRFNSKRAEHYLGVGVEWWFNSSSYP